MTDILYVEDNPDDVEVFRRLLNKLERPLQYTILTSGSDAIRYLSAEGPEPHRTMSLPRLVLLDINLVGISGIDVLRLARTDERTRLLPIIAYSTSDNPSDIRQAYEAGANAYIVKPGSYPETGALLRRLCHFWLDDNAQIDHP